MSGVKARKFRLLFTITKQGVSFLQDSRAADSLAVQHLFTPRVANGSTWLEWVSREGTGQSPSDVQRLAVSCADETACVNSVVQEAEPECKDESCLVLVEARCLVVASWETNATRQSPALN